MNGGGFSDLESVTLALLAGGEGSRMGGPKDRITLAGKGLIRWTLDRLAWPGSTMLVGPADRRALEGQELFGRVVYDIAPGRGPVCGLRTALESCDTDELIVLPLDMPGLGREQLGWLVEHARASTAKCVMLRRDAGPEGGIEPFPCYLRRAFLQAACWNGVGRDRSLRALGRDPLARILAAPPWDSGVWANLNTPADVAAFDSVVAGVPARKDSGGPSVRHEESP